MQPQSRSGEVEEERGAVYVKAYSQSQSMEQGQCSRVQRSFR
jgi:hypothetical protein